MKMRKFADEGFVRKGRNEYIDDDTRARAQKFVEDNAAPAKPQFEIAARGREDTAATAKPKVVTKEELKGMSLRDYMNQQQGLTRRGGAAAMPDESAAESARMARSGMPSRASRSQDLIPTGGVSGAGPTPSEGNSASGSELGRNVKNTLNAVAGLKGVQMGQMAAEAAMGNRAGKALSGLMGGKQAAEVRKIEPTMSTLSAAEKAKLAGELRRGATPTNFTSPSRSRASKDTRFKDDEVGVEFRKGGSAKGYAKGGSVSSRADGIAQRGKTRGRMC